MSGLFDGLFDYLFPTADSSDLPGDSDIRDFVAVSTAGACQSPKDVISDWGDFYGDTPTEKRGDCEGDVEAFYESCTAIDVRITDDPETNQIMEDYDARRYGDSADFNTDCW
jgi:hypothetical protein